jgi:hypothetical protein
MGSSGVHSGSRATNNELRVQATRSCQFLLVLCFKILRRILEKTEMGVNIIFSGVKHAVGHLCCTDQIFDVQFMKFSLGVLQATKAFHSHDFSVPSR